MMPARIIFTAYRKVEVLKLYMLDGIMTLDLGVYPSEVIAGDMPPAPDDLRWHWYLCQDATGIGGATLRMYTLIAHNRFKAALDDENKARLLMMQTMGYSAVNACAKFEKVLPYSQQSGAWASYTVNESYINKRWAKLPFPKVKAWGI